MRIKMRSDEGLGGAHLTVAPFFALPGVVVDGVPEDEGWSLIQNGYADVLELDDEEDSDEEAAESPTPDHKPTTEKAVEPMVTEQRQPGATGTAKAPAKRAASSRTKGTS